MDRSDYTGPVFQPECRVTIEWKQKQIRADKTLVRTVRLHAVLQGVLLRDVIQQAVQEFLAKRDQRIQKTQLVSYLGSPKHEPCFNVQLTRPLADAVTTAAKNDQVSINQFLYTALVRFTQKHKIQTLKLPDH